MSGLRKADALSFMSMRVAYFKLTKQATYKNSMTIYAKTLDAQSSQGIHPESHSWALRASRPSQHRQ